MANTFHWTIPEISRVTIREMHKLTEEHNKFVDRQNKEMNKAGKGGRKTSIGSLGQLPGLPGIATTKRKKR